MSGESRAPELRRSWERNAGAWTAAVRDGLIPSRRAGTDAAILAACSACSLDPVLDVGCGEGWLARALTDQGRDVRGIDASAALVQLAAARGGATYEVAAYGDLIGDPGLVPGPFGLIVCNFALLDDAVAPVLRALADRLHPRGTLLVQTVHPWMAMGAGATPDVEYADGWRVETFDGFGVPFPSPMPWYFRTLESWYAEIRASGLVVSRLEEPTHPETGRPLSLLLSLGHAPPGPAETL